MKKVFFVFVLSLVSVFGMAQEETASVTKTVTGLQVGLFGVNGYNETRLSNKWALRTELDFSADSWDKKNGILMLPAIKVEPKFYYNLQKRVKEGKNTRNNGANYFSLETKYVPNWFAVPTKGDPTVQNRLSFTPTFGIRRNFGKHFNYEFRVGYGYGLSFLKGKTVGRGNLNLSFKVGYDF